MARPGDAIPSRPGERLQIAAAVIADATGERVLLAQRPRHVPHGGLWEFPGGKREPGETLRESLTRELREELDLEPVDAWPFLRVEHDYGHVAVELNVWFVAGWRGEPRGVEGQLLEWVSLADLPLREFPAANQRIVAALQLPRFIVVTPDLEYYDATFMAAAAAMMGTGTRILHFRSRRATPEERTRALNGLAPLCAREGVTLVVNGTLEEAIAVGARGVHLPAREMMGLSSRPVPAGYTFSVSCHDEAELAHAERLGADYAFLGPVQRTASHAGARTLGWNGFRALMGPGRKIPVYALGGLRHEDLKQAQGAGAHGISMISAAWSRDVLPGG